MIHPLALALLAAAVTAAPASAQTETIGEVRVHGNHTTPDADILTIGSLTLGSPASDIALQEARARLDRSGRFDSVEVRKRLRSIDDPGDVLVIILVDERPGIAPDDLTPGPLARFRTRGMWLPVIDYADGYGFTYGARVTFVDAIGPRSRISVPLTWGGERQAAVEVDRTFRRGPVSRLQGTVGITRRVNPHFERADTRREVRARAERTITPFLRVAGGVRRTNVRFGGEQTSLVAPSFDIVLDTRTEPAFPRNAVHATFGGEQLRFADGARTARWTTDVRGYVGLYRSSVLALRATSVRASQSLPPFEQALLGGTTTLRGYAFAYRAGDNLAVASAELRVPLTSPVLMGRLGVKGFVDAGTVYPHGARLRDQTLDRGAGGGVFMSWAVVRLGLDVAAPLGTDSRKARWHFSLGLTF